MIQTKIIQLIQIAQFDHLIMKYSYQFFLVMYKNYHTNMDTQTKNVIFDIIMSKNKDDKRESIIDIIKLIMLENSSLSILEIFYKIYSNFNSINPLESIAGINHILCSGVDIDIITILYRIMLYFSDHYESIIIPTGNNNTIYEKFIIDKNNYFKLKVIITVDVNNKTSIYNVTNDLHIDISVDLTKCYLVYNKEPIDINDALDYEDIIKKQKSFVPPKSPFKPKLIPSTSLPIYDQTEALKDATLIIPSPQQPQQSFIPQNDDTDPASLELIAKLVNEDYQTQHFSVPSQQFSAPYSQRAAPFSQRAVPSFQQFSAPSSQRATPYSQRATSFSQQFSAPSSQRATSSIKQIDEHILDYLISHFKFKTILNVEEIAKIRKSKDLLYTYCVNSSDINKIFGIIKSNKIPT